MRRIKGAYPLIGKSGERTEDEHILHPFQTSGRHIRFHHCSQFIPVQERRGSLLLHTQPSQFLKTPAILHPALMLGHLENLTKTLQIFSCRIPGQPAGFLQISFKCRNELPVQFGECDVLLIVNIPYDCLHQSAASVVTCQGGWMQPPGEAAHSSMHSFMAFRTRCRPSLAYRISRIFFGVSFSPSYTEFLWMTYILSLSVSRYMFSSAELRPLPLLRIFALSHNSTGIERWIRISSRCPLIVTRRTIGASPFFNNLFFKMKNITFSVFPFIRSILVQT